MSLTFKGNAEFSQLSWESSHDVLGSADIKAPASNGSSDRAPLDVVAVIDRSGSMSSELHLVKQTLKFMISKLGDNDQLSIVAFGSRATVELKLTKMTLSGRSYASNVVEKIQIEGSTFLSGGLFLGVDQLMTSQEPNNIRTVLLFTDGEPTDGICEEDALVRELKQRLNAHEYCKNATVMTFGYGGYHNASMLRKMADLTKGMYYFVQNSESIRTAFADCLGGLLTVAAKDIVLYIHPAKGVSIKKVMTKFDHRIQTDCVEVSIGDMYSEESRNIQVLFTIPKLSAAQPTAAPIAHFTVKYIDAIRRFNLKLEADVEISRPNQKEIKEEEQTPQSMEIDEQRNRIIVADALDKATVLGNSYQHAQAKKELQSALDKLEVSISQTSPFTQGLIRDLRQAINHMDPSSFAHIGAKYMYSLSRSLYTQRSSGVSSAAAETFMTSSKRAMINQATPGAAPASASPATPLPRQTTPANNNTAPRAPAPAPPVAPANPMIKTPNGQLVGPRQRVSVSRESMARAVRRLMEDLKEIKHNPLSSVVAAPLENDLFEWHCSLVGPADSPYSGVIFHMILQFPFTYPFEPPTLFFCSFIDHPHVFGSWVCLDMLQEAQWASDEERNKPYTGWSSAYSVQSILLQLQAFLFDEAEKDSKSVEKAALSAKRFACQTCTHAHDKPFPNIVAKRPTKKQASAVLVPGQAPSNKIQESTTREPRVPKGYEAPGPIPVQAESSKSVSAPVPAPVKPAVVRPTKVVPFFLAPEKPAVAAAEPQEETWRVVGVKHTRKISSARAPSQQQQQTPPAASINSSNAYAALIKLRGKENISLAKKERTQVKLVPLTAEEQKRKMRTMKKNQKRTEKRREKRGDDSSASPVAALGSTVVVAASSSVSGATVPAAKTTATTLVTLATPAATEFTVVGQAKHTASANHDVVKVTSPAVAAKIMRELLPFVIDSQLAKDFAALLSDKKALKSMTGIESSLFSFLSDEMIVHVMSFLVPRDLNDLASVCKDFLRLSGDQKLWKSLFVQRYRAVHPSFKLFSMQDWKVFFKQENLIGQHSLICFHSKVSFRDDILGIPISVVRKTKFDELSSPLDFLSYESFHEAQVQKSVWGEQFTHWLPLWINPEHGQRAWTSIEQSIQSLSFRSGLRFDPKQALTILPRLMNTMVVSVMSGNIHNSIKALEGYCSFHRLLLAFVQKYPELLKQVNKMAKNFIQLESYRNKDSIASLGEFLPLLTVATEVSWQDISKAYLSENFDRNVLWAVKQYPGLAKTANVPRDGVDVYRMQKTLEATIVSMRLLCFHVYFFQVARPSGVSLVELAANYDAFFGIPSAQLKNGLQKKVFEILKLSSWDQVFTSIGMKAPSQAALTSWLIQSVKNSARKGYHFTM